MKVLYINEPLFSIGQRVYYNIPEGAQGVVVDSYYRLSIKSWIYEVSTGFNECWTCFERELVENRIYK